MATRWQLSSPRGLESCHGVATVRPRAFGGAFGMFWGVFWWLFVCFSAFWTAAVPKAHRAGKKTKKVPARCAFWGCVFGGILGPFRGPFWGPLFVGGWWQGVAQLEVLQAIATLCLLADHVQDPSLRPVAACAGLPKDESILSLCVMPFRPTVVCTGLPKHESILQPLCDTLSPNGCLHRAADDVHQNGMRQVASSKCFA